VRAQESAPIRFAFWGDPAEQEAYERLAAEFSAAHPEIDVAIDYTPGQSDYYRKITTDFAANAPPDVFLINYRQFGQYAARGALAPVAPDLAASETIASDEYAPVALDAFMFGGEQVCMPQNVSSLVVYYNVDLFTANGVPLPEPGWTWDEFVAAAEALTQDTDGDGRTDQFGVAVEQSMYRVVSFVWSAGGEVVDDLDHPTTLTLDTPEAIAGIEAFVSLGASGHDVVPTEEEAAAEDDGDRFMRGGAAMFLQSRREVPTLRQIEGFAWDVAPLPVIAEPATVLHSDAFCIAAAAEHPEAVWAFVEFAVGETGQQILAETGRIVPSRIDVAESAVFLDGVPADLGASATAVTPLPPASSEVFVDYIPVIHRLPSISTWPEIEDVFNAELDRAFYAPLDVPAAVARVIEESRDAFARAAAESALSP
jgi:multiple sugar transport system substrate-binding protein